MAKGKKRKLNIHQHALQRPLVAAQPTKSTPSAPVKATRSTQPTNPPNPTIPFYADDRILLIGEGDFSFAKSIVEHHGCYEVTATCFDSKELLFSKYDPQAEAHVRYLEGEGQTVLYNVDATKLDKNKVLHKAGAQWDVIVFNFPHVGGKSKDVNRQVRFNQELLVSFYESAAPLLSGTGKVLVTLFEGEPYTLWNIKDLARHSGLEVQRTFRFRADAYPGYSHARTLGNIEGGGGWKGEDREAKTFVFGKKGADVAKSRESAAKRAKKRKRGAFEDGSDDEG